MQVVPRRTAAPAPVPYAAAEASFAETKAYLSSREVLQMRESDLERELNRRGQELLRKLLQGHLDQRSPGEAAGPVEGPTASSVRSGGSTTGSWRRPSARCRSSGWATRIPVTTVCIRSK